MSVFGRLAAARRLGDPRCQELLGELRDRGQRPLRAVLDAQGLSAPEFLGRLFFFDGTENGCRGRRLAYTEPGSHVVFVCGSEFSGMYQRNASRAEVAIVHETLHCLGLGENPPTWREINDWVEAAWSLVDPIIQVWNLSKPKNFPNYEAGSWGPQEADEFIARDGRRWRQPDVKPECP